MFPISTIELCQLGVKKRVHSGSRSQYSSHANSRLVVIGIVLREGVLYLMFVNTYKFTIYARHRLATSTDGLLKHIKKLAHFPVK